MKYIKAEVPCGSNKIFLSRNSFFTGMTDERWSHSITLHFLYL
ncbi:hypothetical protein [Bacillus cereus group sp. BC326]